MRLLVSVRDVNEALDALAGGADVIDVKEPSNGALGAADPHVARAIVRCIDTRKPVSIVIGDVTDVRSASKLAERAHRTGASMVKLGLGCVESMALACRLVRAVSSSAMSAATVVVAYGDWQRARSLEVERVLDVAIAGGAEGLVLDTFDKMGAPLLSHISRPRLERLIDDAHTASLFVGVAGQLGHQHVPAMGALGVDLFGVRGAVCTAGRTARLSRARVRELALLLRERNSAQLAVQSA